MSRKSVAALKFAFQHIGTNLPGACGLVVKKGALTHGLFGGAQTHLVDQQAAGERNEAKQAENVADKARQQQQTTTHRDPQVKALTVNPNQLSRRMLG